MSLNEQEITISNDFIITTSNTDVVEPTESLGKTMFINMKLHQDKIAQIDAKTGQRETFGELLQRSIRTALRMAERNITREDIITLCTHSHLDTCVPYIATQFLGAKLAPIDPSFSLQEMNHLLNTVRPRMIFANMESVSSFEKVLKDISLDCEIVVFGQSKKHTEFSDFLGPHIKEENFQPIEIKNLKDVALIYFSSGTTGLPKGICLSHYAFVGHSLNTFSSNKMNYNFKDTVTERISFPITYLNYFSFYWITPANMLLSSTSHGYCRLLCDNFDSKEIWNLLRTYKPSVLVLSPLQVIEMISNKPFEVESSCVSCLIVPGCAISKEYVVKLQEIFPETDIYQGYGQTETSGALFLFNVTDKRHKEMNKRPEKIGSVGLPVRGTSYKVVDTETEATLGPYQQGELRLKTKFRMNGYYNVDSSDTFDSEGWLKTGDIVYYDEDYCFYIVDRIKEAFKYQGWFIAPIVLENEMLKHPAVKLAVVIGIPKDDGHHPMGLVVLNDGCHVTEKEIEKFIEERVPERQKLSAGVRFIKSVPVTVTGKIKRTELKQMILEGTL